MKVLIVGGGGRCHALVTVCKKSKLVNEVFCAPGNAGMKGLCTLVNISDTDIYKLKDFAIKMKIDLTIVGPEVPLSMGIVDLFQSENLKIFGPTKRAAEIESSKEFAKDLMKKYNVPTAKYETFSDFEKAKEYIEKTGVPTVIKFDGLAYGKGVVVAESMEKAVESLDNMLKKKIFGEGKVVIEEFLEGPEFSFMCLVQGDIVIPLDIAQDHKREGEGDTGENTGGMGAYSPVPFISKDDVKFTYENVMKKVAVSMIEEGREFSGVLYGGLIKTTEGIKVIEFNARFGDPETEVVLPRLESDLVDIICQLLERKDPKVKFSNEVSLGVVLASKGYPRTYEKGKEIKGLKIEENIFHMGTKFHDEKFLTNGGRVLFVVGKGKTFIEAQKDAYNLVAKIDCENLYYRKDIGYQVINFKEKI